MKIELTHEDMYKAIAKYVKEKLDIPDYQISTTMYVYSDDRLICDLGTDNVVTKISFLDY